VSAQRAKLGHVAFLWVPREEVAEVDRLVWSALND
jgi:hypothetical protein